MLFVRRLLLDKKSSGYVDRILINRENMRSFSNEIELQKVRDEMATIRRELHEVRLIVTSNKVNSGIVKDDVLLAFSAMPAVFVIVVCSVLLTLLLIEIFSL